MNLSERIQKLRKENQHSQEQLADILGVSRQAISKWESNQGQPEISNVIKLSQIYNVTTDYLLVGKENTPLPTVNKESRISSKAMSIIAIIGATALITVGFITLLGLLGSYVL